MVATSSKPLSIEALVQRVNQEVPVVNARRACLAVLAGLPTGTPVPNAVYSRAYCADGALLFLDSNEAELERLLELYPPVAVVYLDGDNRALKPKSDVTRGEKHYAMLDMYPIISSAANRLMWWVQIGRRLVKLTVEFAYQRPRDIPMYHARLPGSFLSYPLVAAIKLPESLTSRWSSTWAQFIADAAIPEDLGLHIQEYAEKLVLSAKDVEAPKPRCWFLRQFSLSQRELWEPLAQSQAKVLPELLRESEKEFLQLKKAFMNFFARRGRPSLWLRELLLARIRYAIVTQANIHFHLDDISPLDDFSPYLKVRIRGMAPGLVAEFTVRSADRPDLLIQDIAVVYAKDVIQS